jgi:copper(I)-binding protein
MTRAIAMMLAYASVTLQIASAAPSIEVTGVWSRPAIGTAVVYATIVNHTGKPDRLTGGSSPDAGRVELHESTASAMPMGSMNGMPMNGQMMSMKSLDAIGIPAHGKRTLAPGGYHIMLVDLKHDLKAGQIVTLRLHFARAGWISLAVPVRSI